VSSAASVKRLMVWQPGSEPEKAPGPTPRKVAGESIGTKSGKAAGTALATT